MKTRTIRKKHYTNTWQTYKWSN